MLKVEIKYYDNIILFYLISRTIKVGYSRIQDIFEYYK